MSDYILKNAKLYWEGYDLSGRLTSISLPFAQGAKEDTRFGANAARTYLPGMKGHNLTYSGFHDNATVLNPDKYIHAEYGSARTIITVSANGADEGDKAYSFYANSAEYTPIDGDVGDVAAFNLNATGTGKAFQGIVMQTGQETSGGNGTARQMQGMDENDVAYMAIHCTELDATSLDVEVYSDSDIMMNTPTLRDFSTAQFTAIGAQYCTFTAPAGISGDSYWRISFGLIGGNTTATFIVTLCIP